MPIYIECPDSNLVIFFHDFDKFKARTFSNRLTAMQIMSYFATVQRFVTVFLFTQPLTCICWCVFCILFCGRLIKTYIHTYRGNKRQFSAIFAYFILTSREMKRGQKKSKTVLYSQPYFRPKIEAK